MARRKNKKNDSSAILIGSFLLCIVVAVISGIAYYLFNNQQQTLDKTTLCPSTGANAHTVILIDKTDPLNFVQKKAFQVLIENMIKEQIQQGELLSVYALGEDFTANDKPLIELCNPGDGSDKSELTANVKRLKQQYEERFLEPILNVANELTNIEASKYSPIMEQIQMVAINSFQKLNIQGEKKLIIFSDMLQNTSSYSMYKSNLKYEDFSKLTYAQKVKPDLKNVKIELHYLMNSPKHQTNRHLHFWEYFFDAAGARITFVRPLEG